MNQSPDKRGESLTYLTNIAVAFDPVEGDVQFDAAAWTRIRNAIFDLSTPSHALQNAAPRGSIPGDINGASVAAPSTTRRSDCPLENCEKTGQCEFPQDCDAPSPATPRSGETPITDAAGLWLMAEGPLPADWKCPPGQEADIRQFDHELLGPCTEWKVVTAAIARRLERAASPVSATRESVLDAAMRRCRIVRDALMEDDSHAHGYRDGAQACMNELQAMLHRADGGKETP